MSHKAIGNLSLLTVGVLFGLSAVVAKYFADFLDPYQVVMFRFGIAFCFLLVFALLWKQAVLVQKSAAAKACLFTGVFAASVIFFTLAIFNTTVSLAVFSFYAATLIGSYVLGYFVFGEQLNRYKQIALALTFVSLILFTQPFTNFSLELGFLFGLVAGVLQAATSVYQKQLSQTCSRVSLLFIQTLGGTIAAAAAVLYFGGTLLPTIPTVPLLVLVAFGAIFLVISYLFLVGFKYANLNTGSVLISTELLFAPVFAFFILQELPPHEVFLGGAVMVASLYFIYQADA